MARRHPDRPAPEADLARSRAALRTRLRDRVVRMIEDGREDAVIVVIARTAAGAITPPRPSKRRDLS